MKKSQSFRFRQFLYGIAKHRAWHRTVSRLEIGSQSILVSLAGLAQQPAYCLVDEVMRMMEKDIGNSKGIINLSMSDKGHGAYDSYTLLPDGVSVCSQRIKKRPVPIKKPFPQQRIAGEIHKIPVIYTVCVRQIEVHTDLFQFFCRYIK